MIDFDDFGEEEAELDLTPLIDVVFMLLIFFIMATSFTKPVIDIILPSSNTATKPDTKKKDLVIVLDNKGIIYYMGKAITIEDVTELLGKYPEQYLNLHVDKATPFEAFLQLVDQAKQQRNGEFIITTEQK